jgi:hypothetical protein
MEPADFVALGQNLCEVRPIFDGFCARHGFGHANPHSMGRYPRVRIHRMMRPLIYFDLWMALDANGRRFEHYRPDLPYDLGAGAYVDMKEDGPTGGTRFGTSMVCLSARPLSAITPVLLQTMEEHLPRLEAWGVRDLQERGRRSPIAAVARNRG